MDYHGPFSASPLHYKQELSEPLLFSKETELESAHVCPNSRTPSDRKVRFRQVFAGCCCGYTAAPARTFNLHPPPLAGRSFFFFSDGDVLEGDAWR